MINTYKEILEEQLGISLKDNCCALGIDAASKLGWAIVNIQNGDVTIEFGSIDTQHLPPAKRYPTLSNFFSDFFHHSHYEFNKVIIEDTYLKYHTHGNKKVPQVPVLKSLTRIGMIPWIKALDHGIKGSNIKPILPTKARAAVGLKGGGSKVKVQQELNKKTGINLPDDDIIDAIVCALNGVLENVSQKSTE